MNDRYEMMSIITNTEGNPVVELKWRIESAPFMKIENKNVLTMFSILFMQSIFIFILFCYWEYFFCVCYISFFVEKKLIENLLNISHD